MGLRPRRAPFLGSAIASPGAFSSGPATGMSRISTTHKGRGAPAAAASSAETIPGADESGELADAGLAADILREASGAPDAAERDSADEEDQGTKGRKDQKTKVRKPARTSELAEENDETEEGLDNETEEDAKDQGLEAGDQGAKAEGEEEEEKSEENEGEEETEEESESTEKTEEESESDEQRDDTPEWAKRRFSEMSSQIRSLRAENEQLRQSSGGQSPARQNIADVEVLQAESPEQLADLREQTERLEEWAELNREGVEADPEKPNSRAYTPQEVAQVRINARRKLRAIEAREKQVEHTQRFNAAAAELFPGFKDPDSEESRAAAYLLQMVPELRRLPNYRVIIGDAIANERMRRKQARETTKAKQSPNGKPLPGKPAQSVVRKPPHVNAAPSRGGAAPGGKLVVRQKARSQAFKTGSEADIAKLVEASLG